MTPTIQREQVKKLIGKTVYAVKKDGTMASGKLVRVKGNVLHLQPIGAKKIQTKAVIPLVLFDLLAIGTAPYAFGGFGPYGGGFGPYGGGFGYPGIGYPGIFW